MIPPRFRYTLEDGEVVAVYRIRRGRWQKAIVVSVELHEDRKQCAAYLRAKRSSVMQMLKSRDPATPTA